MSERASGWKLGLAVAAAVGAAGPARADGTTERVSVGPGGVQANGFSFDPALSGGGRFVAFESSATNLVPGDTSRDGGVFVRDRETGTTRRVSLGPGGVPGGGGKPGISANGRFVAFVSTSSNLVPGDTNGRSDAFVRDRWRRVTTRVSVGPGGGQSNGDSDWPAISADGRFVAFQSSATNLVPGDTNGAIDVFVHDRQAGTTRRASVGAGGAQANEFSFFSALSADGRFVVFDSAATNLVPGDTNGEWDVFVRDRQTGTTQRVSIGPGGAEGDALSSVGALSADGRFVAFFSGATNLVPNDTNGVSDVFVRDRHAGTTRRGSLGRNGAQGDAGVGELAISADGRVVAFDTASTNLVPGDTNGETDVFVRLLRPD